MVINNTREKILELMLSNHKKEHNINEISKETGLNYRLTYEEIIKMEQEGLIKTENKGKSRYSRLDIESDPQLFAFIESRRAEKVMKKKQFKVIMQELKKLKTKLYVLILFGSHAKRTANRRSDIDLLFVAEDADNFERDVQRVTKILSYPLHINVIDQDMWNEMVKEKDNVVTETIKNHIVLHGAESYIELIR